jgi:hypothetical protein
MVCGSAASGISSTEIMRGDGGFSAGSAECPGETRSETRVEIFGEPISACRHRGTCPPARSRVATLHAATTRTKPPRYAHRYKHNY